MTPLYFERLLLQMVQVNLTLARSREVSAATDSGVIAWLPSRTHRPRTTMASAAGDGGGSARDRDPFGGDVMSEDLDVDEDSQKPERVVPTTTVTDALLNMISMMLGNVNSAPIRLDGADA